MKNRIEPVPQSFLDEISEFSNEGCGRCLKLTIKIRGLQKQIHQIKGYMAQSESRGEPITIEGKTYASMTRAMKELGMTSRIAVKKLADNNKEL